VSHQTYSPSDLERGVFDVTDPDEIIIMLMEQLVKKPVMYDVTPKVAFQYAADYLEEHGWRRDGLTGQSWIKNR
jgi:hypothetical protein